MRNYRNRARGKVRRLFESLLLLGGLAALGVWIWSASSQRLFQDYSSWAFDRQKRGESAGFTDYLVMKKRAWMGEAPEAPRAAQAPRPRPETPVRPAPAEPAPAVPRPKDNEVMGRLSIPRLKLSAMVREGVGENTLRVALGHIPETALPGQAGNVGLAGHRDTLFRGLREIRKNDRIDLETMRGTYSYRVESTTIVKPSDVSVLRAVDYQQLTLVTCYPFYYVGSAPDRFIVKARLVDGPPAVDKSLVQRASLVQTPSPAPAAPVENSVAEKPAEKEEPEPPAPAPVRTAREEPARPGFRRVPFEVYKGRSRQVGPGISFGVTGTDPSAREIDGWMWLMPDRRTIWLRTQSTHDPVVFYTRNDGRRRELRITHVASNSVSGYLLVPDERAHARARRR